MLQKSDEIEVPQLVEQARKLIDWSPKQNNNTCFIPYIDESLVEIRYLHFTRINENWVFVDDQHLVS